MIRIINVRGLNSPAARANVVYVGRPFAGWPGHPLANPFRPRPYYGDTDDDQEFQGERRRAVQTCLDAYRAWLLNLPKLDLELAELWEVCGHGGLPLGCWCVDATAGDGSPVVCHAQILAEMLRERFAKTPDDKRR